MTQAEDGVQFPMTDGRRSTMATGRATFAAAAEPVDRALARRIRATKEWRKQYLAPARDLVSLAGRRPEHALNASVAGLDYLWDSFVFIRDGQARPFSQAMEGGEAVLATHSFVGGSDENPGLVVPYKGRQFVGSDLRRQVRLWVRDGVAEPSFQAAMDAATDHPEWFDLRDRQFVLLGAGAELGPLRSLLRWGAQVLAVDLPRPQAWKRIIAAVEGTPGVLHVPVPAGSGLGPGSAPDDVAAIAGADLLRQGPEIVRWIDGFSGQMVVGNYLYADGAINVRLSMAADALAMDQVAKRGPDVTLAFLATPTDAFQVTMEVVEDSRRRWDRHLLARATRWPNRLANLFQPNYPHLMEDAEGHHFGVADCLVPQQGPNYLLAKRLQRWRAIQARSEGVRISLNVAPSTRTQSVVKNNLLAAAYAGAGRFGMEIFEPETCNALMAAMLVRDLNDPSSVTNPEVTLEHPSLIFSEGANHGGLWRSAFSPRSVLGVAAVVGMIERAA